MHARRMATACLLVLLFAPVACAPRGTVPTAGPATNAIAIERGVFQGRILLTGELQAMKSEKIIVPRTPVWDLPIRWMEADGTTVVRGQTVLELDNTPFTGDLTQKQLAESRATNDLARKEADVAVSLAEKEFALEEKRVALEKAQLKAGVPREIRPLREFQEDQLGLARAETEQRKAQQDLETARRTSAAELAELRIGLARAREEIRIAQQAIDVLKIAAPRDGILVVAENAREGRKLQVGDTVWVGLPVMELPDLSAMRVVARLSDVDDGRISAGMRAICTLDMLPERSYAGRVAEITPVAQEGSEQSLRRSFRVEILLDEANPEAMRPGMSVKAEVLPPAVADVLLVPRSALEWTGSAPRVRLEDGSAVAVRLGPCNAALCTVEEGLAPGARVRASG